MCFFLLLTISAATTTMAFGSVTDAAPEVAATAAILMDAKTGRILWERDAHKPMAMASTTKIMTAILALESGRSNEMVTVSRAAAAAPRMKMDLTSGEKIRLGDLMLALMLESSNDAAVAIAEHLGGDVPTFCAMMTAKARELGAKNTIYETPNGLDAGDHHSTAYDLAIITRYALDVPGFIQLTNTANASFSSNKRSYSMVNKNRLLQEYSGANGVKTGFTGKAGHCFVGAAKRDDMQLISVVLASGWGDMGRARKWIDTKAILNYGFNNFTYEVIIQDEHLAGTMPITRSRTAALDYVYSADLTLPLHTKEKGLIEVRLNVPPAMQAPVDKGAVIGQASVFYGDQLLADIDLVLTDGAARHDYKTSLEKVLNHWFSQVIEVPVEVVLPEFELPFTI